MNRKEFKKDISNFKSDIEMAKSVSRRVDEYAGNTFSTILKVIYRKKNDPWIHESNNILASEVRDQERDIPHLDQYLKIIGTLQLIFFSR